MRLAALLLLTSSVAHASISAVYVSRAKCTYTYQSGLNPTCEYIAVYGDFSYLPEGKRPDITVQCKPSIGTNIDYPHISKTQVNVSINTSPDDRTCNVYNYDTRETSNSFFIPKDNDHGDIHAIQFWSKEGSNVYLALYGPHIDQINQPTLFCKRGPNITPVITHQYSKQTNIRFEGSNEARECTLSVYFSIHNGNQLYPDGAYMTIPALQDLKGIQNLWTK